MKGIGLSFNYGFCHSFMYEDAKSNSPKTSNVSKKGSNCDDQQGGVPETEGKRESVPASDGENSQSEKVCLSTADGLRTLLGGPQFSRAAFRDCLTDLGKHLGMVTGKPQLYAFLMQRFPFHLVLFSAFEISSFSMYALIRVIQQGLFIHSAR